MIRVPQSYMYTHCQPHPRHHSLSRVLTRNGFVPLSLSSGRGGFGVAKARAGKWLKLRPDQGSVCKHALP
jgi:hypothetical protein